MQRVGGGLHFRHIFTLRGFLRQGKWRPKFPKSFMLLAHNSSCLCLLEIGLNKVKIKVKSAYGPMWPTRPELTPVSVA